VNQPSKQLVLVQLPRTARASLATAFRSVGVDVHLPAPHEVAAVLQQVSAPAVAVLRHPVDRLQSWFNLRLRSGRPHRPQVWSDGEAALFSVLRTFDDLGHAVTHADEWMRSVGDRAVLEWSHGYQSLLQVLPDPSDDRVAIIDGFHDLPAAVASIAALIGCAVPALPDDAAIIDATPASLRGVPDELALMGLRIRYAEEIAHYRALLATARS